MTEAAKIETASYLLCGAVLFTVIFLGLVPALLAGLLVYHLVELGAVGFSRVGMLPHVGRLILLAVIAIFVVTAVSSGIVGLVSFMTAGPDSLGAVMHKMADVVDAARSHLPEAIDAYLPSDVEEWQAAISKGLRENATRLSIVGHDVGLFFVRLVFGMIIGGVIALQGAGKGRPKPLAHALDSRVKSFANAFRRVVFSQIRISTLNTFLTAVFLYGVMPLLDRSLPLTKTLITVTFIAGLIPIVGNLISNTMIVLVALSVAPLAAVIALVFLIVIHKLEYFVNAHIIGSQIRARAWELLIAMLVMEVAFGMTGLIAAPIYYAYLKDELSAKGLV